MNASRRWRGPGVGGAFTLLAAIFLLFDVIPLAALVYRAVAGGSPLAGLTHPLALDALWLSALTSGITIAVTIALGTPLAYLLARRSFPGRAVVDTLVDVPLVLPPVVAGVALLMAFGRQGLLGRTLDAFGLHLAFTTAAVVLAQTFVAAPFYIRAAKAGFQGIDPALEQIAATLGASPWRIFREVTVPLARPALLAGAVLCWARAVSEFGATMLFAGNLQGRTQTFSLAIMTAMEADLQAALALAVLLLALSFAALVGLRLVARPTSLEG